MRKPCPRGWCCKCELARNRHKQRTRIWQNEHLSMFNAHESKIQPFPGLQDSLVLPPIRWSCALADNVSHYLPFQKIMKCTESASLRAKIKPGFLWRQKKDLNVLSFCVCVKYLIKNFLNVLQKHSIFAHFKVLPKSLLVAFLVLQEWEILPWCNSIYSPFQVVTNHYPSP